MKYNFAEYEKKLKKYLDKRQIPAYSGRDVHCRSSGYGS